MAIFNFSFRKRGSGDVAKDRLKLVLVADRLSCSDQVLEMLKDDIIKVISKYMEIDESGFDVQISNFSDENPDVTVPTLSANIPIKNLKTR